jgi:general nucleoside transport system ATP-binding protein
MSMPVEVSPQAEAGPLLRIEGLSKRFPQVLANDSISLTVQKGEIHCLLGENGAGKSTLAEVLYGVHRPDAGTIYYKGKPVVLGSPKDAIRLGIGMVHQHFILVPPLSVMENIVIGTESAGVRLNLHQATKKLDGLCSSYGIMLDPAAKIWHLCVGEQQWVEILKALYVGVELLILDEPTAALTPQEAEKLFDIIRKMRAEGLSIIFITHKLKEVMEVSDRVTVLRKGKLVATVQTSQVTQRDLARMMVGREVVFQIEKGEQKPGQPVLEVLDIRARDDRGTEALQGVSLTIRSSEILGLAGVSGNGQRELFDVITGVRKPAAGKVILDGKDVTGRSPSQIASSGVASVPEDRIHQGLVMDFRVEENLILGFQRQRLFARGPFLSQSGIEAFAQEKIGSYEIMTPSARQITKVLSGGNLQKVIMARELAHSPKLLVVSQPTRGLDVGATEYVRRRLLEQRDCGAAILLISEDLDEIFNLSTRIAVMFKGKIVGVLDADEATLEEVGLLMAGCV